MASLLSGLLTPWAAAQEDAENRKKQKAAESVAQQQVDIAQQGQDLAKQQVDRNGQIYGDTYSQIFGGSPVDAPGAAQPGFGQPGGGTLFTANGGNDVTPPTTGYVGNQRLGIDTPSTATGPATGYVPGQDTGGAPGLGGLLSGVNGGINGIASRIGGALGGLQQAAYNKLTPDQQALQDAGGKGTLTGAYETANQGDAAALAQLQGALGGITDPTISDYVGDTTATQASDNPADAARQQAALNQLQGQTGVSETAEEKLMRYMAQRKQEQQEQSNRLAAKNDLQSRGVYGSGAEIASMLGSNQNTGAERTISELGAQANAQQRAMAALQAYNTGAATARGQSTQLSEYNTGQTNTANQLNQGLKEQHNQFATGQQSLNNKDKAQRAATSADATFNADKAVGDRAQNAATTRINLAGATSGSGNTGVGMINSAGSSLAGALGDQGNVVLNAPTKVQGKLGLLGL